MVIDYTSSLNRKVRNRIVFSDVLLEMYKNKLLITDSPSYPILDTTLNAKEFLDAFNNYPIPANDILRSPIPSSDNIMDEKYLFPLQRSVFCQRHIPYMNPGLYSCNFFEVTYICEGEGTMVIEDQELYLTKGDFCIVSPNVQHCHPSSPDCTAIAFIVRRSTFDAIFSDLLLQKDIISDFFWRSLYSESDTGYLLFQSDFSNPKLQNYFKTLVCECLNPDNYGDICAVSVFKLFLAEIFRGSPESKSTEIPKTMRGKRPDAGILLQYINQNFASISLPKMAEVFHYNTSYLSRVIYQATGNNFSTIITNIRLRRSEYYLLCSDFKIQDIAELVGYSSFDHYSRTFKKMYGISPSEYRMQHKKRPETAPL